MAHIHYRYQEKCVSPPTKKKKKKKKKKKTEKNRGNDKIQLSPPVTPGVLKT